MRIGGETSVLVAIARTISRAMTRALKLAVEWDGANPDEASFELSTDFTEQRLSADDAFKWFEVWQSGALGDEDLYNIYHRGGAIEETVTFEDWLRNIEERTQRELNRRPNPEPRQGVEFGQTVSVEGTA